MNPIITVFVLFATLLPFTALGTTGNDSCRNCHENPTRMLELGAQAFTITQQDVEQQSHMPATCSQCHLGNPDGASKDEAHQGLARLIRVRKKGLTADITPRNAPLEYGSNEMNKIYVTTEKDGKSIKDANVVALSWHDKRTDNLTQDFVTLKKTCGTCHPQQFEEFSRSTMGTNAKQTQYKSWIDKDRGPHNCGTWFDGNYAEIQANTMTAIPKDGYAINQRACNTCHVGCLDCHFNPQPRNAKFPAIGAHSFVKTPTSQSCYGNGRASICHAGPEDRRRGAGYFGGSFSFPEGNKPDVHVAANVGCLDCHESTKTNKSLGHGMVKRQAYDACPRCHSKAVKSHVASVHKNLSCEACHIQQVAGYQGTYWGPGKIGGAETAFLKYKAYYGIMQEPILIKDQKGRWIPVKPFPMAVMNQKQSPYKPGLQWRFPATLPDLQRTDDAWAYTGLHGGLPENNKALTWLQIDKMSHKLGKARSCDSCHEDSAGRQLQKVSWDYSDPGAAPFSGSHTVIADKTGLYIKGIKADEPIILEKGYTLSAFAPWFYLKEIWAVPGDFSLPALKDRVNYDRTKGNLPRLREDGIVHK
ncbi:cytochrome c, 10 heme-binding sites [Geotalea daltonii FRC-32]|uniref:Cytochrome c, 10 heme-binding sites n=1 Tax=Geotalea daltonii (strain DSM 22248 / JCM 15807 / FRC-32) TaxID=316067 RepID=B9M6M2_GEODF|nr:cytochrome c3 family protein [Geotalea daltonii]ACM20082.1 cytochrome c, 10 heme-binding sites [Geotalea daltonii FRC-32]